MDRLRALETLKAVVDHNGFARGADALNMAKSAATRLIQELEDEMGACLLIRTTRKLALTSVGQCVYDRAVALISSYEELSFTCKENVTEPCGRIRVEVPALIGLQRLGPILTSFLDEHPKVKLDLHIASANTDVLSDLADVAICVDRCIPQSLVARPLAALQMGLYASGGYIQRVGMPRHPRDLIPKDFMALDGHDNEQPREFFEGATGDTFSMPRNSSLSANQSEALIGAAIHGAGVALVPCVTAQAPQYQGLLVPVLMQWWPRALDVHLVYRSPRFEATRVRNLINHLLKAMSRLDMPSKPVAIDIYSRTAAASTTRLVTRELMVA